MSAIVATADSDPFAEVLQSLKTTLASVQPLLGPIQDVKNLCADLSSTLDYASDVPSTLTACQESLETLSALCQALIEVPFVDVVAEVAAGVMEDAASFLTDVRQTIDPIIQDVVTPCKAAFDDLAQAMGEAATLVTTLATTVPGYLNTVEILSYCLDLAQAIVPVLGGTSAADATQRFIASMVAIRSAVTQVAQPIATCVSAVAGVVNGIVSALGSAGASIQSALNTVKSGLAEFESIVSPIKSAFDAIENAIAPVKWVLDAVDSLIQKILAPVVNAVLEATGLKALLAPLLDQIERALGVQPLFQLLQTNVSPTSSQQWQSAAGTAAVAQGQSAWTSLATALAQYDSRDKGSTYQLIMTLVDALTGSPSGPGPFELPDWPATPPISGLTPASSAELRPVASLATAYARADRSSRLALAYTAMQAIAQPSTVTLGAVAASPSSTPWLTDTLVRGGLIRASYDDVGLPFVTQLLQAAANAKSSLQSAEAIGPTLVTNLQNYDSARLLPVYFQQEMQDFASLFADGVKVMEFLLGFSWAQGIFADFAQAFRDQAGAAADACTQAQQLVASGQTVDTAIQAVAKHEPTPQQFASALQYIDQVAAGAATLGNTLRRARALDAKLQGQFTPRIDALQTQANASAQAALQQMLAIQQAAGAALSQASVIDGYLIAYAAKFTQLGSDAASISATAMPKLAEGVRLCNTVAAILDPLSGLLTAVDCQAKNAVMASAGAEVSAFKSAMQSIVNEQQPKIVAAFDFIANKTLPSAKVAADVADITSYVSTQASALNTATTGLSAALDALASGMVATQSYSYQATVSFKSNPPASIGSDGTAVGGGASVTKQVKQVVANMFVSETSRAALIQLASDMNKVALAGGITAASIPN